MNAPRWKSKNAVVIKVKITFFVKIRWKGRVRVSRAFSLKALLPVEDFGSPIRWARS